MVDVLYYTADNTVMTDMAKDDSGIPQRLRVGEVDDKYVIEQLRSVISLKKGMEKRKQRNASGISMEWQEVLDTAISSA